MEAAGIEPASGDVSIKNVYMRILLLLTLQAKPAAIIGVRWATTILPFLSGPDQPNYRRQPDWVIRLRSPHRSLPQAARAGALLKVPTNILIGF